MSSCQISWLSVKPLLRWAIPRCSFYFCAYLCIFCLSWTLYRHSFYNVPCIYFLFFCVIHNIDFTCSTCIVNGQSALMHFNKCIYVFYHVSITAASHLQIGYLSSWLMNRASRFHQLLIRFHCLHQTSISSSCKPQYGGPQQQSGKVGTSQSDLDSNANDNVDINDGIPRNIWHFIFEF